MVFLWPPVGRQQPRRALRARGCRSAAAGQTTSGNAFFLWRTKSASRRIKSANWRTQVESLASRRCSGLFLADRPPVDGGSDRIRSDPRRTQADSADFFGVRLSPPESASADLLADWLADPIGSDRVRSDPPRIRRGLSPPIIVPYFATWIFLSESKILRLCSCSPREF